MTSATNGLLALSTAMTDDVVDLVGARVVEALR